jgi:hypothetical protein
MAQGATGLQIEPTQHSIVQMQNENPCDKLKVYGKDSSGPQRSRPQFANARAERDEAIAVALKETSGAC